MNATMTPPRPAHAHPGALPSPPTTGTTDEEKAAALVAALAAINNNGKRDRMIVDGEEGEYEEQHSATSSSMDTSEASRRKMARLDGHPNHHAPNMLTTSTATAAIAAAPQVAPAGVTQTMVVQYGPGPPAPIPQAHQQQQEQQQQQYLPGGVHHDPPTGRGGIEKVLRPFPYFYYRDFSQVPDPDPLAPLTAPGRVPNFPAKMHSILSRGDLADIVSWNDHGRAWRVLKPREFEVKVIPTYFEHAKFSSFVRQANGWGFRRITQGRDRNSYYHEQFLRGLPHLCKMMKRPGVAEKQASDPDQEPDFYRISEAHPVPDRAEDESIMLQCTLQGGPKARMPIYFGALTSSMARPHTQPGSAVCNYMTSPSTSTPNSGVPSHPYHTMQPTQTQFQLGAPLDPNNPGNAFLTMPIPLNSHGEATPGYALHAHQSEQHQHHSGPVAAAPTAVDPSQPFPIPTNTNPQFAAGFAAAAALSQQHFQSFLGQALAQVSTSAPAPTPFNRGFQLSQSMNGPVPSAVQPPTHSYAQPQHPSLVTVQVAHSQPGAQQQQQQQHQYQHAAPSHLSHGEYQSVHAAQAPVPMDHSQQQHDTHLHQQSQQPAPYAPSHTHASPAPAPQPPLSPNSRCQHPSHHHMAQFEGDNSNSSHHSHIAPQQQQYSHNE